MLILYSGFVLGLFLSEHFVRDTLTRRLFQILILIGYFCLNYARFGTGEIIIALRGPIDLGLSWPAELLALVLYTLLVLFLLAVARRLADRRDGFTALVRAAIYAMAFGVSVLDTGIVPWLYFWPTLVLAAPHLKGGVLIMYALLHVIGGFILVTYALVLWLGMRLFRRRPAPAVPAAAPGLPVPAQSPWSRHRGRRLILLALLLALPITTANLAAAGRLPNLQRPPALGTVCDDYDCNGAQRVRSADGMTLVYVPAGRFAMGSVKGDSNERPVHTVALDGFWLDRNEVTIGQYDGCADAGACAAVNYAYADNHPVSQVTWEEAAAYCHWAGAQLPTEAQWEYAARGPGNLEYPWGNRAPSCRLVRYNVCGEGNIPVGTLPAGASWVGAQDMAGNVWEWVADWYSAGYYAHTPATNPPGPDETTAGKVRRGGSWVMYVDGLRAADRASWSGRNGNLGFRCAVLQAD